MKKLGTYLVIGGIGSGILSLFDLNFKLLMWIDLWGETTGWLIRAGLVVVGGLLVALAGKEQTAGTIAKS